MTKKQKSYLPNPNQNPYREEKPKPPVAKKPLYTWTFILPGLALGIFLGWASGNMPISLIFGLCVGVGVGSAIDVKREKKEEASGKKKK